MDDKARIAQLEDRLYRLEKRVSELEAVLAQSQARPTAAAVAPSEPCVRREQPALTVALASADSHPRGFPTEGELTAFPRLNAEERLQLFMELFGHRRDFFALRWESKTGSVGYSPKCANRFRRGVCNLAAGCSNCPHRVLEPLTVEYLEKHLDTKHPSPGNTVGVYPLDACERTSFLAIDLDHKEWQPAAQALVASFSELGVAAYCERSRSGDGAHIWVFFSETVPAKKARDLGSLAVTLAMEKTGAVTFSCYDRMFPCQDTLLEKGFGNCIALPLQAGPRMAGCSVFVDVGLSPYHDQWSLLQHAAANRFSPFELAAVLEAHAQEGFLGMTTSMGSGNVELDEQKPWARLGKPSLEPRDFPEAVRITRANKLYVSNEGLSQRAVLAITRLATFSNPEYYKRQALRKSVYKVPRVITCASSQGDWVAIPRGCEEELLKLIEGADASAQIIDETDHGKRVKVSFAGELRPDQLPAAEAMLAHENGALWAATAFGKTVVAAYLIAKLGVSTAILVHNTTLVQQWQERLHEFLNIDEPLPEVRSGRGRKKKYTPVGVRAGGKDTRTGNVDIFTYQAIFASQDPEEMLKGYGMLIVDEFHHSAAVKYESVITASKASRIYGVSATPVRGDGHHPISFMLCGPLRFKRSAKEQAAHHSFDHVVIPRFTGFKRPLGPDGEEWGYAKLLDALAQDTVRSKLIVGDALSAWKGGRSPLVLTERVSHAKSLLGLIEEECPNAYLLIGEGTAREKRERVTALRQAAEHGPVIAVATGRFAGEGFDLPRLDTLCLASPVANGIPLRQYIGRLNREYAGKQRALVYDYVDFHEPMFESMYHKRLKGYASEGYRVAAGKDGVESDEARERQSLYTGASFRDDLIADIESAAHELIVCSPLLHKSRFFQVLRACVAAQQRGVRVLVVTQLPAEYAPSKQVEAERLIAALSSSGLSHVELLQPLHRFMTVDSHIVWYGSANAMGYWSNEDCMARLDDADVATALQDSIRSFL
ncbi:MAG: TOTE conflict system archaeo-eukaryotic primase domain-containing protein [Coriobacteriales bacterium]